MNEATANFIGKDGFNWWVGQVENSGGGTKDEPDDKDETNKVKVRIVGYHNPSRKELPTKDLPWSMVMMPNMFPQRSGIGTVHQLQINGWVVGFFMDGAAAQVPIVLGSVGDENPKGAYKTAEKEGEEELFPKLVAADYVPNVHAGQGTGVPGSGSNVTVDSKTGNQVPVEEAQTTEGESEDSTINPRGEGEITSKLQDYAESSKCYTVQMGNGKCGTDVATKLEGPLLEFMKFSRGVEKNAIGEFVDKATGRVADVTGKINTITSRVTTKLRGITGKIKGVALARVGDIIDDQLMKIPTPNPKLTGPIKANLEGLAKVVNCVFGDLLNQLKDFIKGLLTDLFNNVLDMFLCLIQDFINAIMNKLMDLIDKALGMIDGLMSAIKGAMDKIQSLLKDALSILDLFCEGSLSCAVGASTYETCHGPKAKGKDAAAKKMDTWPTKPPMGFVPTTGNLKGAFAAGMMGGVKSVFNVKTGALVPLASAAGKLSGIASMDFKIGGPLEAFENFKLNPLGGFPSASLNCNSGNKNKKPCFPEMVWDNLQSTAPIKALPIVDRIGSIVGSWVRKKGKNVSLEATVRAQFTCNEPEGGGAVFKPNIKDGKIESIDVIEPGIGYGFDPAETYCPKEQYNYIIPKGNVAQVVENGQPLFLVSSADGQENPSKPDVMQVVDVDYSEDNMIIATLDPTYHVNIQNGMVLQTVSGDTFTLNYTEKYADLVVPDDAKAVYAECGDLIPIVEEIKPVNVGTGYKKPIITIGTGPDKKKIGEMTIDEQGRLVKPVLSEKVIGFVTAKVEDTEGGQGAGGTVILGYSYAGPIKVREKLLGLESYIDCVGHPVLEKQV